MAKLEEEKLLLQDIIRAVGYPMYSGEYRYPYTCCCHCCKRYVEEKHYIRFTLRFETYETGFGCCLACFDIWPEYTTLLAQNQQELRSIGKTDGKLQALKKIEAWHNMGQLTLDKVPQICLQEASTEALIQTHSTLKTMSSGEHLYRTLKALQEKGIELSDHHKEWIQKYEKYGDYFWTKKEAYGHG